MTRNASCDSCKVRSTLRSGVGSPRIAYSGKVANFSNFSKSGKSGHSKIVGSAGLKSCLEARNTFGRVFGVGKSREAV